MHVCAAALGSSWLLSGVAFIAGWAVLAFFCSLLLNVSWYQSLVSMFAFCWVEVLIADYTAFKWLCTTGTFISAHSAVIPYLRLVGVGLCCLASLNIRGTAAPSF